MSRITILQARRWTVVQGSLFGGLVFLAVMYLFNLPFYSNLTIDWYYWWWVIHLWVEGAWELIAAALTGLAIAALSPQNMQPGMRILDGTYGLPPLPDLDTLLIYGEDEPTPAVREFGRGIEQQDDVTAIVMKVL